MLEITAWHWFDFICPFCYFAGSRNRYCGAPPSRWCAGIMPRDFPPFTIASFSHFGLGEDIGSADLVDRYASQAGAGVGAIHRAISNGSAIVALEGSESAGRRVGVEGTPAWLVGNRLISGLQPEALFEQVVRDLKDGTDRVREKCSGFPRVRGK
jgi:predicted DsbA family dithiol-disulfide isomerase